MNVITLGNTELVEYGIQNETSDLRAHVCPNAGMVYVYPTKRGLQAIDSGKYPKVNGFQPGIDTATSEGYLVPPSDIWGCMPINARWHMDRIGKVLFSWSTTDKGLWAVNVVAELLKWGWFPLWGNSSVVEETDVQIKGIDIVITSSARVQVKCDFDGGEPKKPRPRGSRVTGNLFLQVAECNPFRQI